LDRFWVDELKLRYTIMWLNNWVSCIAAPCVIGTLLTDWWRNPWKGTKS